MKGGDYVVSSASDVYTLCSQNFLPGVESLA